MNIYVTIATSFNRHELLFNRSLLSVYQQKKIDCSKIKVFIIDDNVKDSTDILKQYVQDLRNQLRLTDRDFETTIMRNQRKQGYSGSGAWNTAIFKIFELDPNAYISILDDDDLYLENYLEIAISKLDAHKNAIAIFQQIKWINEDTDHFEVKLTKEKLKPRFFFIGNPGVQGSNMFFKCSALVEINGFDENFPNTTDRELMIRFLQKQETMSRMDLVHVIEEVGVWHYNHKEERVSSYLEKKQLGLDLFYQTFKDFFSEQDYQASLSRAQSFFKYKPTIS